MCVFEQVVSYCQEGWIIVIECTLKKEFYHLAK